MSDGSTTEKAGVRKGPLANQITEFLNFCKIEKGLAANSLSAYAADLEHFLKNEPISARPPSAAYRLQKLVRRNKLVFAASAAVALAVVSGLVVSTWMFFREREARRQSQQVALLLENMLRGIDPSVAQGRDTQLLREVLDKTVEQVAIELKDDPRVQGAIKWIRGHYTLDENIGMGQAGLYYYYHTFAKTMAALGEDTFTDAKGVKHDWRADLTAALAKRQKPDGSWTNENDRWMEKDPNLVTGYALMALSYCQKK